MTYSHRLDILARVEHLDALYVEHGEKVWNLSLIRVHPDHRNQGAGTAALKLLCEAADKAGVTVTVNPTSEFGTPLARLHRMYAALGFVHNTGRHKDYELMCGMYRTPRPAPESR